jgi:hypothetical protein
LHGYGRGHTIGKDRAVTQPLVIFDADGTLIEVFQG